MRKISVLLSFVIVFNFLACSKKAQEKKELTDYLMEQTNSVWRINDWSSFDILKQTAFSTDLATPSNKEIADLLKHLQASKPSLLTATETETGIAYTLIAPQDSLLLPTDSTQYKIVKKHSITSYTNNEYTFYASIQDSIVLTGTNETVIQEMLQSKKLPHHNSLLKLLEIKTDSDIIGVRKNNNTPALAEWSVLDFSSSDEGFLATGILQSNDSLGYWNNLMKHQKPQPIKIADYTPSQAKTAWAMAYQEVEELKNQLEIYSGKTIDNEEFQLLEASDEIGCIQTADGTALILNSLNNESLTQLLTSYLNIEDEYREVPIYKIENQNLLPTVKNIFCNLETLNWLVVLDDYFIFSDNQTIVKEFITAKFNKHLLAETKAYQETAKTLSSNASFIYYSLDGKLPKEIQSQTALELFGDKSNLNPSRFPLLALQLNAEKNFSHINFLAYQNIGQNLNATKIVEDFQIKLEENIVDTPIYFSNHSTHRKDILVQDQANTLHLFNSVNGNKYWFKQLNQPVLGEIHEIDLYKNGRKQIAFATENRLYVLDRNGKDVAPFPIVFKDKVTQGLAVFDYSNNSDYRFVILQGKNILMYDKNAKIVRGFEYTKATSEIIMPAQHLRIGNRDYLVFAEANGKLNILDRRGNSRVNVSGKYDIKTQPVELERGGFVFYTNDLEKINLSTSGAIQRQKLEERFYKTTQYGVTVFLQSQNLRINQKNIELPFGLYTNPKIFRVNKQNYITLTDIQESKTYVYNQQGILLHGFPVYGKASAFIADANRNGKSSLIVQTEEKEITQYSIE